MKVESGALTNLVVNTANTAGLAGLEGFMGIPGTIGGAIYNNAHYDGNCIGDKVYSVDLLEQTGERRTVHREDLEFGYDTSVLQRTHAVVLSVDFELSIGDPELLSSTSLQSVEHRRLTQPLEFPSSGCMFKNLSKPTASGVTSVGALIDQTGLKGMRVGGAQISDKHANFIINTGGATTQNIIDLSNQVSAIVKQKWSVTLDREVFIIDEYGERIENECL
jgi:UDP-N-acetylmuramate dehydrogenase